MIRNVVIILVLLLLLVFAGSESLAQSNAQIVTEVELADALCVAHGDKQSKIELLKTYPQLVTRRLWSELSERAAASYYEQSSQSCLEIYEALVEVATRLDDAKLLATTYYNLGRTYSGLNQFPIAIESYEKSRGYFEKAGLRRDVIYILADVGAFYFIQDDYERAKEYSERSLVLADTLRGAAVPEGAWPDDFGCARSLLTLGEIDLRDGNQTKAIERFQNSLRLYQNLNGQGSTYDGYIAGVYGSLGKVYPLMGDYARALFYLSKARDIAKNASDQDTTANIINSIGFLYMEQEDYGQAKALFEQSSKIYLAENNQIEACKSLMNLAVIEQRQTHYDEALKQFRLGLKVAQAARVSDAEIAAGEGIGAVLTTKRDFFGALEILNQSLGIAKDTGNKTRQAEVVWRSAQVYYEMGKHEQATALAESAVTLAAASHLPKLHYLATATLGELYIAQGRDDLAVHTLTRAIEEVEGLREQIAGSDEERELFFENKVAPYQTLIDLLVRQGKTPDALVCAERAKGRVLLDVLSNGKREIGKMLSPAEVDEVQTLNRRISEINDRIRGARTGNPASLSPLYLQLETARLDYQSFQNALYVAHPGLDIRSGRTAALTYADVNGLTQSNDTGYLEYVVGKDRVSLFVLTKDQTTGASDLKVYSLAIKPEDLVRKVNEFHDMLAGQHPTYASAARELYTLLVEPAEQQLRDVAKICIVPDTFLWNVPFQALIARNDRFLIEDRALFYAPSLSVLREISRKKPTTEKTDSSVIAFGNPVIGKDEQRDAELCPLPEAETEVISIAKSFGQRDSKIFIGRDASEKTFRALAPTYSVIHLATHGIIDNRQPLYSHLLLTKTEGDLENDGRLEAREIMDMNLNADLAVLSACETANGRISPGEGVIGLSWAFFVAGTRSMVVSQWKANSASTSELMTTFYQNLHSDQNESQKSKAQAIRRAALTLLKDDRYRHPFYWAGFVVIGNGI